MKDYMLKWGSRSLELGERTCIMGILNVTPDSFSDGGIFYDPDIALAEGLKMVEDGADILDIGGESTRPFSDPVSTEEEIGRVVPIIRELARKISVPISIDTKKAEVARQALEAGASIINDISALQADPDMTAVAAEYGVPLILMHMKGMPRDMQVAPTYDDLIGEIREYFGKIIEEAVSSGVSREMLIIDPGIGFGKTFEHNLCIIKNLKEFESLDTPILMGTSRKTFIRKTLKNAEGQEAAPLSPETETGTQATVAASILNGAHIVRVHNVANTRATVRLIDAIRNAPDHPQPL